VLWGLGPHVLLGVGDATNDDWETHARAERQELLGLAAQLRRDRELLNALARLTTKSGDTPDPLDEDPDPTDSPTPTRK
jgi:hypothetical protein